MRVAFGTDETTALSRAIVEDLTGRGHQVATVAADCPWPVVGRSVAEAVASGAAERGVVCCWTGTGVSIAANRVPGTRAALCVDAATAVGARRWNDANVLAISLRLTSAAVAAELLEAFFATEPDADEAANIAMLS